MYNSGYHVHQVFYRYHNNKAFCNLDVYSFRPTAGKPGGSISILICKRHTSLKSNLYHLSLHLPPSPGSPFAASSILPQVNFEISTTIRRAASLLTEEMQEFLNENLVYVYYSLGDNLAINATVEVMYNSCDNELNDAFEKLMLNNSGDRTMMEQQMSDGMNTNKEMLKVGEIWINVITDDPCTICDRVIMQTDEQMKMNCGHYYHYKCLMQWLIAMNKNSCPICRSPLLPML